MPSVGGSDLLVNALAIDAKDQLLLDLLSSEMSLAVVLATKPTKTTRNRTNKHMCLVEVTALSQSL